MFTGFKLIQEGCFRQYSKLCDYPLTGKSISYINKMEQCFLLYTSQFMYKNLPKEMLLVMGNRNYLDAMLFFQPAVCFFRDNELGIQCLPTTGEYKFNIVGRPVEWTARAFNGKTWQLNEDNSVIMYNDEAMSIPFLQTDYYINYMVKAEESLKQNLDAIRFPWICETEEEALKSAQAQMKQISNFEPIIFKRKPMKKQDQPFETKVFQTGVQLVAKDLDDVLVTYFNKILTYYGINNINVQDKKERLITSEASANDMLIQTFFTSKFNMRDKALKQANKMFGTNMSVKPNDLTSMVTAIQNEYSAGIVQAENKNNGSNKNDNG